MGAFTHARCFWIYIFLFGRCFDAGGGGVVVVVVVLRVSPSPCPCSSALDAIDQHPTILVR